MFLNTFLNTFLFTFFTLYETLNVTLNDALSTLNATLSVNINFTLSVTLNDTLLKQWWFFVTDRLLNVLHTCVLKSLFAICCLLDFLELQNGNRLWYLNSLHFTINLLSLSAWFGVNVANLLIILTLSIYKADHFLLLLKLFFFFHSLVFQLNFHPCQKIKSFTISIILKRPVKSRKWIV